MPSPSAAEVKRKRGAQPHNTNALKHGFYSRGFREIELEDLDQLAAGLESEIASLRVQARRFQEVTNIQELDVDTGLKMLSLLGAAFTKIATLLRTHAIITGGGSEVEGALNLALEAVIKELSCQTET